MPVRRLRSLKDAEQSVWLEPDDPRLWKTIRSVWELADRLYPPRFPPGAYKYRTIEDLNRQKQEWEALGKSE
jgi:hypothetical protein